MGKPRRNWWWDRGYTSRGLAGLAGAYGLVAVAGLVATILGLGPKLGGWVLPAALAMVAIFYVWQAHHLRAYQQSRRSRGSEPE